MKTTPDIRLVRLNTIFSDWTQAGSSITLLPFASSVGNSVDVGKLSAVSVILFAVSMGSAGGVGAATGLSQPIPT